MLVSIDEALAAGDGMRAIGLVRQAQQLDPRSASLGVRLIDSCLMSGQLLCAAHGARTVLRSATAADDEACRSLSSARILGHQISRLWWCPVDRPSCEPVTNRTAGPGIAAGSLVAMDDGNLVSAENFVATLKRILADDVQWKGDSSAAQLLNHATMQHIQGNQELARTLYARALNTAGTSSTMQHAHAHANLAALHTTGARARHHLEAAVASPKANQVESSQTKSSQVESRLAESSRVTSSHVESRRVKASQGESSQVEARRHLEAAIALAPDATAVGQWWLSLAEVTMSAHLPTYPPAYLPTFLRAYLPSSCPMASCSIPTCLSR